MLQFTSLSSFTCPTHPFIIIRNRNLKKTLVLSPSCRLSFCKYGTPKTFSLYPTTYYHSQFRCLQVSIAHIYHVRVSSMFLFLSVGNYTLRRPCVFKDTITDILGFVKTDRMVQMYKCN